MDFQPLYSHLFNSITNALDQMQKHNYGLAAETLVHAQLKAEAMYLDLQENHD